MQKARETADASYYGRAEQAFEQARRSTPTSGEAIVGLAWVQSARHEFEKSIEWAQKALALDAANAAAYGLLGDAALELGDYDAAAEHYQRMLDLRPDISAYSRSAHLLFVTGDVRRATWLMDKAIKAGGPYAENTAWCRAQLALMHWQPATSSPPSRRQRRAHAGAEQLSPALRAGAGPGGRARLRRRDSLYAGERGGPAARGRRRPRRSLRRHRRSRPSRAAVGARRHRSTAAQGQWRDWRREIARFFADHDRDLPEAVHRGAEFKRRPNVFVADTLAWATTRTAGTPTPSAGSPRRWRHARRTRASCSTPG